MALNQKLYCHLSHSEQSEESNLNGGTN